MYEREQLDPVLKGLDADVATAGSEEDVEALKAQIKGRENALLPMYLQVCMRFCGPTGRRFLSVPKRENRTFRSPLLVGNQNVAFELCCIDTCVLSTMRCGWGRLEAAVVVRSLSPLVFP